MFFFLKKKKKKKKVFDAGLTCALAPDIAEPFGYFLHAICTRMSKERKKKKKRKKENRKKEKNLGMVASTNSVEEVTERLRDVRG